MTLDTHVHVPLRMNYNDVHLLTGQHFSVFNTLVYNKIAVKLITVPFGLSCVLYLVLNGYC